MGQNTFTEQINQIQGFKIGYYGPIDQRINFELVKDMADYHPAWNFIFADADSIDLLDVKPQRPNIYFFKAEHQNQLLSGLKNLDIALIPYNPNSEDISEHTVHQFLNEGLPLITNVCTTTTAKYELMGLVKTAQTATGLSVLCEEIWNRQQQKRRTLKSAEITHFL